MSLCAVGLQACVGANVFFGRAQGAPSPESCPCSAKLNTHDVTCVHT